MSAHPRVPVGVSNPFTDTAGGIQVNHCRMPDCDNYGVAARTTPVKPGPSKDNDPHYKLASTNKGRVSALVCKCCGEKPPIKSNQGIAEELARISKPLVSVDRGCTRKDCDNHGKSSEDYPDLYHKTGTNKRTGRAQRGCKSCGTCFLIGLPPPRIHPHNQHLASPIFSRVVNKAPVRRTLEGIGKIDHPRLYYDIVKFIQRRCNHLSGGLERGMLRGKVPLPAKLHLVTDLQQYQLNWTDRMDKRNPMFSAVCTVDKDSLNVRMDGLYGSNIIWAAGDPVSRQGWESSQSAMIMRLLPHIRQALGCARALEATAATLLENRWIGVVHLDRRGRVLAANDRARTRNTVYWYLKQIYQKLNISRQADLVRLVLSVADIE